MDGQAEMLRPGLGRAAARADIHNARLECSGVGKYVALELTELAVDNTAFDARAQTCIRGSGAIPLNCSQQIRADFQPLFSSHNRLIGRNNAPDQCPARL